jgi:polyphosphate glucokinase
MADAGIDDARLRSFPDRPFKIPNISRDHANSHQLEIYCGTDNDMPDKTQTKTSPATGSASANALKILVVDVGGTNVKMRMKGQKEATKVPSGPTMTASKAAGIVKQNTKDWSYDRISLGYPGPIINGRPLREPHNLGGGWVGFDFNKAFGVPVRLINDAAMQAVGSYKGGRMLFLGLGTGLGSAMIVDGVLEPMELAHLLYKNGKTYEDYLGLRGLERMGKKRWRKHVAKVTEILKSSLGADYVVLGGGNVKKLKDTPPGAVLGNNENAFIGGLLIWGQDLRAHPIVDVGSAVGSGVGKASSAVAKAPAPTSPKDPASSAKPKGKTVK